jgi:hypothetical protein
MNYRQEVLSTRDLTLTDQEQYLGTFTKLSTYAAICEDMAYTVVGEDSIMDTVELLETLAKVRYHLEMVALLYGFRMEQLENTSIQLRRLECQK